MPAQLSCPPLLDVTQPPSNNITSKIYGYFVACSSNTCCAWLKADN